MVGVAAATALGLAVSLLPLRGLWEAARSLPSSRRRLATLPNASAAVGLTLLLALPSFDLLVAKLAFTSHRAGVYAAASIGARGLLLVPMGGAEGILLEAQDGRDIGDRAGANGDHRWPAAVEAGGH